MKRILFTGGGSAGHVIPNLAVMRELRYTYEICYMGTGGIEQTLVQNAGYPFYRVDCPKLVRRLTLENLKIPHRLRTSKKKALDALQKRKPDLVFSKGGFASYPAVWAAYKMGIPVLTHESDLSPGLCTRLIAKKCTHVLTSFPETAELFANGVCVGSPIRREVLNGERTRARRKYSIPETDQVLLVFGGGSGSKCLNEAVESALPRLLEQYSILHITGKNAHELRPAVGNHVYIRREFETDMGSAYAAADLILSRAGSNTVFEILALKKRALLVPLAHASRGDQVENAEYFARKNLVKILPEEHLSELYEAVENAFSDGALSRSLAISEYPSGTGKIVQIIKSMFEE